jgi:hypothetical protein
MFWWILGIIVGLSLLVLIFLWVVLDNFAKAAEEAHKDGWDNPFE